MCPGWWACEWMGGQADRGAVEGAGKGVGGRGVCDVLDAGGTALWASGLQR